MIVYDILVPQTHVGTILPLMCAHAQEIYGQEANLDVGHVAIMINAGFTRFFIARDDTGIIGYTFYALNRDIFKAHLLQAECIAVYVKPERRNLVIARKLIKFSEIHLANQDRVNKVVASTNNKSGLEAFYKRMGYEVANKHVMKEL